MFEVGEISSRPGGGKLKFATLISQSHAVNGGVVVVCLKKEGITDKVNKQQDNGTATCKLVHPSWTDWVGGCRGGRGHQLGTIQC
ncbi:hypothetical protein Pcinc_039303 [Petrolisthes cinctipes]|uniref:Uncharacterized protein n=1 Tax=Petrolisthes cinctipes TaxID=88211 RepID=A0AAE1BP58_PETCI|nr:hypothetical protein Pcinc_039303 [Petrolisthes cinctipes]